MAKATKTIKQALSYRAVHAACFAATQTLFNQVAAFYVEVIQAHPDVLNLSNKEALSALEHLTHVTKEHPHSLMPLSALAQNVPAMFRRAAINAALGSARSFSTHLARWRKHKEQAEAKGKKCTLRPPVPPRRWNKSTILYAGMWKEHTGTTVLLKLWTGQSWSWIKVRICGRQPADGWETKSPQLVLHHNHWWLHFPIERVMRHPKKVETQVTCVPDVKICAVDLNITEHLAVCTIQTVKGTVIATRFIGGGKQLHGLRKRLSGRIARNRRKTGIIAEGEQDNAALWAKIRAIDEDTAHQVSHRIIQFAQAHGASILVFEHLAHFKPQKGKYSKRGNEKRSYWLKGRIFKYARYQAWNAQIVTCRVNPKNSSRECARCQRPVARYNAGQPAEEYTPGASLVWCSGCQMRGNADRNASMVIGQRLLVRYQTLSQEKPHTPLHTERSAKAGGVSGSQVAKRRRRPSTNQARHGAGNAQGTAQDTPAGMAAEVSGIPHPLRLFNE